MDLRHSQVCFVYLSHRVVDTYFGISMLKIASGAEQGDE